MLLFTKDNAAAIGLPVVSVAVKARLCPFKLKVISLLSISHPPSLVMSVNRSIVVGVLSGTAAKARSRLVYGVPFIAHWITGGGAADAVSGIAVNVPRIRKRERSRDASFLRVMFFVLL